MDYLDLSKRQQAILEFIMEEIRTKGYPPSVREIGEAVGLSSPSTVHSHLATLEQKGYIRRDKSKPRALEIIFEDAPSPFLSKRWWKSPFLGRLAPGSLFLQMKTWRIPSPSP